MRPLFVAALSLSLVGCYQSHPAGGSSAPPAGSDGGLVDAARMPPVRPSGARAYVIHVLDIPAPTGDTAPGADLDGIDSGTGSADPSATCEQFHVDFRGVYDDAPGVDDAYGQLIPTIDALFESGETVRGRLAEAIASGELLLVLEHWVGVSGLRASLHLAEPLDPPLALGPTGSLAAGQRLVSIATIASGTGDMRGGRVVLSMGDFDAPPVPDWIPAVPFLRLRGAQLSFVPGPEGLRRGMIGGGIRVEDGVEAGRDIVPGLDMDSVRPVLESIADLGPSAGDPSRCERVSLGMTFEALPAVLVDER